MVNLIMFPCSITEQFRNVRSIKEGSSSHSKKYQRMFSFCVSLDIMIT